MNPVQILVIDDQLATDLDLKQALLDATGASEAVSGARTTRRSQSEQNGGVPMTISFCRGQDVKGDTVVNDYGIIKKAIGTGKCPWSLILLDVMFVSGQMTNGVALGRSGDATFGETVRGFLLSDFPDLPVVLLTSMHQDQLKQQDLPFLSKDDLTARQLAMTLIRYGRLTDEQLRSLLRLPTNVVIASQPMRDVFCEAFNFAPVSTNILLLGESGVGKEIVAEFIHNMSLRASGPFESKNVAAMPDNLVESELFGHERGSFSGATGRHRGAFERASKGTLFLDEIGDMAPGVQAKVLRALEGRKIQRVGSENEIRVDIRLISATNQDLYSKVQRHEFRGDLLSRIDTKPIVIPPLRERRDDILLIAEMYLDRFETANKKHGIRFSPEAQALLEDYHFPGNVRELRNLIEGVVIEKGSNTVVRPVDLRKRFRSESRPERSSIGSKGDLPVQQLTLQNAAEQLAAIRVDPDDKHLKGAAKRMTEAVRDLMRRIMGAALQRKASDTTNARHRRSEAVRYINHPDRLTPTNAKRILNELLGRNRTARELTDADLNALVQAWLAGPK